MDPLIPLPRAIELFGSVPVSTYGLGLLAGVLLFWLLAGSGPSSFSENERKRFQDWTFYVLIAGLVGGRLSKQLVEWDLTWSFRSWLPMADGSMSLAGGLIVGTAAAWLLARSYDLDVWQALDELALPAAVGLAGASLFSGLAGHPWEGLWAVPIAPGVSAHPVPLYLATGFLGVAAILGLISRRDTYPGERIITFLLLTAALRFTVGAFTVQPSQWLGMSWGQLSMLLLAALSGGLLLYWRLSDASAGGETQTIRQSSDEKSARHGQLHPLVGIIVFALVATAVLGMGSSTEATSGVAAEGYPAPDFTATTLSGETVTLSELRGQPVYLNFWATWCGPCRREMPAIQQLKDEYEEELVVVGMNLTFSENSLEDVRQYVEEGGYSWIFGLDPEGAISDNYRVRAVPTSIFIDDRGVIRSIRLGEMDYEQMQQQVRSLP